MTLTNRLSVFFLAGLAAVLVGFSVALFLIARAGAYRELDQRVDGALDAMTSAVEVKPKGVEWEPDVRGFTLSAQPAVTWGVFDGSANLASHSRDDQAPAFLAGFSGREDSGELSDRTDERGELWRMRVRRVNAPEAYFARKADQGVGPREVSTRKQATVLLVAAAAYAETDAYLRRVATTLAGTSCAIWLAAALLARWFCRRALAPVRRMAEAARVLQASDLSSRLPAPATADEVADLARSFNDLLGRVQEAYERQRGFTTEASHQFRTPLAGILAQADVVLRGQRSADEYRRAVGLIRDRAEDLRTLVEAMLFLARADADAAPPDSRAVELTQWLRTALARWAERPGGAEIQLTAPANAWVLANPVFLAPLLDNLLDNALKYRFPNTPVTVSVEPLLGSVALGVSDRGPGIPASDLPRVFDPFFRTHDAQLRGVPGLGLGLAVARRLAEAIGGKLSVESDLGQGTRVTLSLPAASVEEV